MPNNENLKFYRQNIEEVKPLLDAENSSRIDEGREIMTAEEVDAAMTIIRGIAADGGDINTAIFPGRSAPHAAHEPKPTKRTPRVSASQDSKNTIKFEIQKGENGHVLKTPDEGGKFFIFKDAKELLGIIGQVVFGDKKRAAK